MSAVSHHVHVSVRREADRGSLTALLEPLSVPLDRRPVDAAAAALTDANLGESLKLRNDSLGSSELELGGEELLLRSFHAMNACLDR
jgi:hypothetical protein